jgi:diguanylate cyclase (GGDEF)-like protein/PAS domain S-box-containing protein
VARPRVSRPVAGAAAIVLALYVADAATRWTGAAAHGFLRNWFVVALYAAAAAGCLLGARRAQHDGPAWLVLGAGIAAYGTGTLVYSLGDPDPRSLDAPVVSQVLWLAFYAAALAGVGLLLAPRARRFPLAVWLDAVGAGLSLAAVVAAVALPAVEHPLDRPATVAVGLAFPCLDLVLITLMVWVLSLGRWRPHPAWILLMLGFVLLGIGDTAVAIRGAEGVFVRGELTSACFPLAMLALALAAWQEPPPRVPEPTVTVRLLLLPVIVYSAAVVLLGVYVAHPFPRVAAGLAVAALVVGIVRAGAIAWQVRGVYESRRYARGFQDAAHGMALVDWDMRWLRVNPALCEMLRRPAEELVGHSVLEVTHEEDVRPVEEERSLGLADPHRSTFGKRYVRSDGAVLEVELTTSLIEDEDVGRYFYTQVRDVTDRRRTERRQALIAECGFLALEMTVAEEFLEHAMATLADELDLLGCALLRAGDDEGRLEYVAHAGPRVDPYPADSMAGRTLSGRRAIVSDDVAQRAIAVPVRARRPHVLVADAGPNRDPFDSEDARFLEAVANILASVVNRDRADRELRRRALVDDLTGLANRAMLDHHLAQALAGASRIDYAVAVLLLDLDNFKYVNDTLGHPAGDELLRALAARLRQTIRSQDLLARLGGDEFVVVCTIPADELNVSRLAERLLRVLEDPFPVAGQDLQVSASLGIAVSEAANSGAAEMLRDADIAMYRAKARAGNGYEVFDADLRRRILTRVQLERELREALRDDGQLLLYYQPIVDLAGGGVRGFESLVRWQHPRDGLLSPAVFLPIAEESGLIVGLGERLLDFACARMARWSRLGKEPPYVSFNLSGRQITSEVPRTIARCLDEHGADPARLVVEVTESVLLNPDVAVPVLWKLREMGIRVALDDFGTGYSSLSYLETYPLDAIKLDRGFVARASHPRSAAILRAAVEMGTALGLTVIAEGIENEEQRELLQSIGCTIGQGYLFARPLPPADADALVAGAVA